MNQMDKEEVKKLAALSRLAIGDDEAESLAKEIEAILDYVKEVEGMRMGEDLGAYSLRNVVREDTEPHLPEEYTQAILSNSPSIEGKFIKVKKIM